FPSIAASHRTWPSLAPSAPHSTAARSFPTLFAARFASQTSPGTTACDSSCAAAPTLPPASQTAAPDARTLPAPLPLHRRETPRTSVPHAPPSAAPVCVQRSRVTLPFPP